MKKYPDIFLMMIMCTVMFMFSFSSGNNHISDQVNHRFEIPDSLFHSGDIIFRDGRGFISNAFRKLSLTDARYSHAGIIHLENGKIFVYHVIGGEENKNNRMRMDRLVDFCSSLQSNGFAIFRSDQNGNSIDSIAQFYFSRKLEFDARFDLNTDDKMYCTELIYKIMKRVSKQDNFLPLTILSGIKYEACDNIYLSPHFKKIYSHDYSF